MKYSIKFQVFISILLVCITANDYIERDFLGLFIDVLIIWANSWRIELILKNGVFN